VFWQSTLWSLLIEEIYYAVYPLMRRVLKRFGRTPVLSVAFAASIVTARCFPKALSWNDIGPLSTAVVLYPVWLLGCKLSERAPSLGAQRMSRGEIWRWRFAAWAAMWVSELLNLHLHVTRVHTMVFVGAFAAWAAPCASIRGCRRATRRGYTSGTGGIVASPPCELRYCGLL
jgi:peptidoglycan/LPS O-acetylase OafA/YrhL